MLAFNNKRIYNAGKLIRDNDVNIKNIFVILAIIIFTVLILHIFIEATEAATRIKMGRPNLRIGTSHGLASRDRIAPDSPKLELESTEVKKVTYSKGKGGRYNKT